MMVIAQTRLRCSAIATICASIVEMSWRASGSASVRSKPARMAA
jgi:hypothetical protein